MQSVLTLPVDPNADPNRPREYEALAAVAAHAATPLTAAEKLKRMSAQSGDISHAYPPEKLAEIGETCVSNYERDKRDRKDWEEIAEDALNACSQEEKQKVKDFPWAGASNMRWPLLTIAAMQFNARMYPAIVKGDEAVLCKVIGQDNGKPKMAPNPLSGEIQPLPKIDPQTGIVPQGPDGQPIVEPDWEIPPGAKAKRAKRVSEYMNTTLFYRMENWEDDTDSMLMQLPAVGSVFRKIWADENGQPQSATISALNLIVPQTTRSLKAALRITEEIEDVYPHEIYERMASGFYRTIDLGIAEAGKRENDGARMLLEQHCRWDFDEDGLEEPYIVTLDKETRLVLRIEPNFGPDDVRWLGDKPISISPGQFYIKYSMFPHAKGNFYGMGLGHVLKRITDAIDTMLNQLIDAGTAQTAGGGFIGSGVRLQSRGAGGTIRMEPGKYKVVDVPGQVLKDNIVERTLPNVSPVTFQVLDMVLGAARDIASIKDVITGEASNQGQVGTTLALIEQGLQVFNSCAKRVFRNEKDEFELLFDTMGKFGGEVLAADYLDTVDDQEADFAKDFTAEGLDIRPVSDPASVTRMQKMAKAQFRMSLYEQIKLEGGDGREVIRRTLEAVDEEDIDKILPPPPPPDPMEQQMKMEQVRLALAGMEAKAKRDNNSADAAMAKAMLDAARTQEQKLRTSIEAGEHGVELGMAAAQVEGEV